MFIAIPGALSVSLVVCFQAFSVMEQLRTHCATEISELERMVGSQQELLAALHKTYPEQVRRRERGKPNGSILIHSALNPLECV